MSSRYKKSDLPFLLFQQKAVQSTILLLFFIVDKILQTNSVDKKSAAAAIQKDMAVSDTFKLHLKKKSARDVHK